MICESQIMIGSMQDEIGLRRLTVQSGAPSKRGDGLNAAQLAAMQTMDDARREGVLSDADAQVIEELIRAGHVHGAKKRVSTARRAHTRSDS